MRKVFALGARASAHHLFPSVLGLVVLLVVDEIVNPGFLSLEIRDHHLYGSLVDILRNAAPVALIALGMTLVIATRGIDLSVGAVAAIAGAIACTHIAGSAHEGAVGTTLVASLLAVLACVALGCWNGLLVSVLRIQPIIATLVLMTAGRGIAMLVTGGQITTVNSGPFDTIGNGFVLAVPLAILIAIAAFLLTALVTRRTALGMLVEAVGINPEASRLAGVRARTIVWTAYAFSGLCAGVAGLMIASNTSAADANNAGLWIELDAILAVVIGGTSLAGGRFSLTGSLLGALLITTLATTIPSLGIPSNTNYVFKAVVVIVVCLAQSPQARGLLRLRLRRRDTPSPSTEAAT